MKDIVRIEDIETQAVVGAYEFEWEAPQPLVLDVELTTSFDKAFVSDDLDDALNYDAITQTVREFVENSRYKLLETMAGGIIREIMANFPVDKVGIRIRKPKALKRAPGHHPGVNETREQMETL